MSVCLVFRWSVGTESGTGLERLGRIRLLRYLVGKWEVPHSFIARLKSQLGKNLCLDVAVQAYEFEYKSFGRPLM
jgi:hypothetical protein